MTYRGNSATLRDVRRAVRLNLATAAAVLLAWVACVIAPVLLLAVVALACVLIVRRHWIRLAILAGLSPITAGLLLAIASYRMGSARLFTTGLPSLETYNVDPETRLQHVSSGCIVSGGEFLWQLPNNLVLRGLVSLLGPMRGVYDGPLPSTDEARAALAEASEVSREDLLADSIALGTQRVRLRRGLGSGLDASWRFVSSGQPRAALWRSSVLVLGLPADPASDRAASYALVDIVSSKVIAYHKVDSYEPALPRPWT